MVDIYLYFLSMDFDRKKRWRDQDDDIKKRGSILPQLAKNRNNMPFNNDVQKLLFTVSKWRFLDLQNDSNFSCAAKNYFSHLHH